MLEYLGRVDHQVKIRGQRLELGEVEAALQSHPAVRACVVTLREDGPGGPRLAAYVVPGRAEPTRRALREHLLARLPDAMVPAAFARLDALPLLPSGKVDRKALPDPEASPMAPGSAYVAPRTPVEQAVAALWEESLGVTPVGATDDFFALGGHSLLATRLMAAMKIRLGHAPPVASLFEHPTVEAMAAQVDAARARSATATVPAEEIQPAPRTAGERATRGSRGSSGGSGSWSGSTPRARAYHVPLLLRVRGPLDERALRASLRALADRHAVLRTAYPEVDGVPVRQVADEASIPVRLADLSSLAAEEGEAALHGLLAAELSTPFDLERGPVIRALLVRAPEDEHFLALLLHHIVTDGESLGVLARELPALYEASLRGEEARLPALAYPYDSFARAEGDALAGARSTRRAPTGRASSRRCPGSRCPSSAPP